MSHERKGTNYPSTHTKMLQNSCLPCSPWGLESYLPGPGGSCLVHRRCSVWPISKKRFGRSPKNDHREWPWSVTRELLATGPFKPCQKLPCWAQVRRQLRGQPATLLTHINVTLSDLHRFQASIFKKVPACHLGGEQFKEDLITVFEIRKLTLCWMDV